MIFLFPIFILFNTNIEEIKLKTAEQLTLNRDYEASEDILKTIDKNKVSKVKYHYFRMINNYKLLNEKETLNYSDYLSYNFNEDIPERYRVLAELVENDIETWNKNKNDFRELNRKMDRISDRLVNGKGGQKTQNYQREVIKDLDRLIENLEQKKKEQEGKKKEDKKESKSDMEIKPLEDSQIGGEEGKGFVDIKKLKKIAEVWGKLPEKERVKAMVELTRNLPTKYKEAIEIYFKELNKKSTIR